MSQGRTLCWQLPPGTAGDGQWPSPVWASVGDPAPSPCPPEWAAAWTDGCVWRENHQWDSPRVPWMDPRQRHLENALSGSNSLCRHPPGGKFTLDHLIIARWLQTAVTRAATKRHFQWWLATKVTPKYGGLQNKSVCMFNTVLIYTWLSAYKTEFIHHMASFS